MNQHRKGTAILVVIALSCLGQVCGGKSGLKKAEYAARVTFLKGKAYLVNGTEKRDLKFGEFLTTGAIIETSENSQAELFLKGSGIVRIGENAHFELNAGKNGMSISMNKGTAAFFLKRKDKGSEFRIKTPTAIASVRGTSFIVEAEGNDKTRIALFSGKIMVENKKKQSIMLDEKGEITVLKDGDITRASILPLSKRSLAIIKKLAVFHRNNIFEYNTLLEQLKKNNALVGLEIGETVKGRYAKLSDRDQPGDSVKKASRADAKFIKKDTQGDPIKLKTREGYEKKN